MKFEITKAWKELPYTICTIVVPSIPGIIVCSSDAQPTAEDGIRYSGQVVPFYSEQKLWVKIPNSQKQDSTVVTIENFI